MLVIVKFALRPKSSPQAEVKYAPSRSKSDKAEVFDMAGPIDQVSSEMRMKIKSVSCIAGKRGQGRCRISEAVNEVEEILPEFDMHDDDDIDYKAMFQADIDAILARNVGHTFFKAKDEFSLSAIIFPMNYPCEEGSTPVHMDMHVSDGKVNRKDNKIKDVVKIVYNLTDEESRAYMDYKKERSEGCYALVAPLKGCRSVVYVPEDHPKRHLIFENLDISPVCIEDGTVHIFHQKICGKDGSQSPGTMSKGNYWFWFAGEECQDLQNDDVMRAIFGRQYRGPGGTERRPPSRKRKNSEPTRVREGEQYTPGASGSGEQQRPKYQRPGFGKDGPARSKSETEEDEVSNLASQTFRAIMTTLHLCNPSTIKALYRIEKFLVLCRFAMSDQTFQEVFGHLADMNAREICDDQLTPERIKEIIKTHFDDEDVAVLYDILHELLEIKKASRNL